MSKRSAGLVMCRQRGGRLEVLLVHPGGPFFRKKDEGAWTLPKGLVEEGEDPLATAKRELVEETGFDAEADVYHPLGEVKQKGGKVVTAWAFEGDCDPAELESNTFELEWPPRSGQKQNFPEVDRAAWFPLDEAHTKINPAQRPFLTRAAQTLR
ncbi:MAG: NUDIX domain-containing protein [Myxococcota bacterium]